MALSLKELRNTLERQQTRIDRKCRQNAWSTDSSSECDLEGRSLTAQNSSSSDSSTPHTPCAHFRLPSSSHQHKRNNSGHPTNSQAHPIIPIPNPVSNPATPLLHHTTHTSLASSPTNLSPPSLWHPHYTAVHEPRVNNPSPDPTLSNLEIPSLQKTRTHHASHAVLRTTPDTSRVPPTPQSNRLLTQSHGTSAPLVPTTASFTPINHKNHDTIDWDHALVDLLNYAPEHQQHSGDGYSEIDALLDEAESVYRDGSRAGVQERRQHTHTHTHYHSRSASPVRHGRRNRRRSASREAASREAQERVSGCRRKGSGRAVKPVFRETCRGNERARSGGGVANCGVPAKGKVGDVGVMKFKSMAMKLQVWHCWCTVGPVEPVTLNDVSPA